MRRVTRPIYVLVVCLSAVVAIASGFIIFRRPIRAMELFPGRNWAQLTSIEGDVATYEFALRNPNVFPVRLREIQTSCGCSTVNLRSGVPLSAGLVVAPNQSLNVTLGVNTAGQIATKVVRVQVASESLEGHPVPLASTEINVRVKGGPRIEPINLVFQDVRAGEKAVRELVLSDGQDEPVRIKEVKLSDREHFSVEVLPVNRNEKERNFSMKLSYRLLISYISPNPPEMSTEYVEIIPESDRFPPLRVPIYLRSSKPDTGFVLENLVLIVRPDSPMVKRTVMLKAGSGSPEVKVVSHPPFVTVEVGEPRDYGREIDLSIDAQRLVAAGEGQKIVVSTGDGKEYTLPIKAFALQ